MEQQKGTVKKFFYSKSFLLIGVLFLFILFAANAKAYLKQRAILEEIESNTAAIDQLRKNNGDLKIILEKVKSNSYVEEVARTSMNMVKPGENQIIIIKDDKKNSGQDGSGMLKSSNISNPRQWWNYFFNHN
jgi:cell division protein FtsB